MFTIAVSSGLRTAGKISQEGLDAWERLGEGGFSSVYKAKLKGNDVAVKVLKNLKETKPLLTEGNLLRFVFCILITYPFFATDVHGSHAVFYMYSLDKGPGSCLLFFLLLDPEKLDQ